MEAIASSPGGTVLLVGDTLWSRSLGLRLTAAGHLVETARDLDEARALLARSRIDAVLVIDHPQSPSDGVIDALRRTSAVPLISVTAAPEHRGPALRSAGADEVVESTAFDDLVQRTHAAVQMHQLWISDVASRRRFDALVRIGQLATTTLDRETILRRAVEDVAEVVGASRCSVVLVAPDSRQALVVASLECPEGISLALDLDRYPELQQALVTRKTVLVQDAPRDPMMAKIRDLIEPLDVRSVLVQPLISDSDVLGVLFLRVSREDPGFVTQHVAFIQAAANALTGALRQARLQGALERQKTEIERLYAGRFQDLSEANAALRTRVGASEEALSILAHDLRGALMALQSRACLLLEDDTISQTVRSGVSSMRRQGERMADLVSSLLDDTRIRAELLHLTLEPFDLAAACRDVALDLEALAMRRDATVSVMGPATLEALGDVVRIRQVVHNLVSNAIAHSPPGGEVLVEVVAATALGEPARVRVGDEGPGIPEDDRPTVFERYARSSEGLGLGLGLSLCRDIVERHGGDIWFEDRAGGGTRFCFTLPGVESAGSEASAEVAELPVLMLAAVDAETDARIRELVRGRCRLERVSTGAELILRGRSVRPAAILLGVPDTAGAAESLERAAAGCGEILDSPLIRVGPSQDGAALASLISEALAHAAKREDLHAMARALRRAGVDALTTFLDRRGLEDRLVQELERGRRYKRKIALVTFVPQDTIEEKAIIAGGAALESSSRGGDVLAHLGGGLFAVVLVETSGEQASAFVTRVAPALGAALGTVIRAGIASDAGKGEDGGTLLARALQAGGAGSLDL